VDSVPLFIKKTYACIFVPDENDLQGMDLAPWKADLKKLDHHFSDYLEIVKSTSKESYEVMQNFADQLKDHGTL
jgi:hypothetical protein